MRKNLYSLHLLVSSAAFAVSAATASSATLVFQEDFGTLAPTTPITTSNTGLGGARQNDGSLTAKTSTIGTGSSLQMRADIKGGTPSGAWIAAKLATSLTAMTMEFTVKYSATQEGALGIAMGNGNSIANNFDNNNWNRNHFLWEMAIRGTTGSVQYWKDGAYKDAGYTLTAGTAYQFVIQANATSSTLDGVAPNQMRLYINGVLVSDSLPLHAATGNANGFRIGGRDSSSDEKDALYLELDDIRIWNGITAIPEPSMATLSVIGSIGLISRRRRSIVQMGNQVKCR
jgi:hypothetical protein